MPCILKCIHMYIHVHRLEQRRNFWYIQHRTAVRRPLTSHFLHFYHFPKPNSGFFFALSFRQVSSSIRLFSVSFSYHIQFGITQTFIALSLRIIRFVCLTQYTYLCICLCIGIAASFFLATSISHLIHYTIYIPWAWALFSFYSACSMICNPSWKIYHKREWK